MADGSVTIDTSLNNKGFEKGLGKLGSLAKTGLKAVTVATGAVVAGFAGIVTASVKARGEIEQQIGGTEAVFGKFAKEAQDLAIASYSKMGTSANDYMATINKMGSLMQGSGISQKKSLDLSANAMQRAADVASIMGIDINSAMESVAGAAKGNFTMMDNLGVAMNATTIESYALSKGIKKAYKDMSNSQKIQLAMEMFLEKSAYAAGNYAKENDTLAGSMSTLKASWENFLSGSGDLSKVVGSAMIAVDNIVRIVSEAIPNIIDNITANLPKIFETGGRLLQNLANGILKNMPTLVDTTLHIIQTLLDGLIKALPEILKVGIEVIAQLIQGIAQMLPSLIPQAIDCIITLVETLLDNVDMLIDAGIELIIGLADGLIIALPRLIDKIPTIIEKLLMAIARNWPKLVSAGIQLLLKVASGLVQAIPQLLSKIPQIIGSVVNAFGSMWGRFTNIGSNMVKGIWNGIKNVKDWLFNKIKSFKNAVLNKFKSFFGIHSPSTLFRDEIGDNLALGIGEGFNDSIGEVYRKMKSTVDFETQKLSANLSTTANFNRMLTAYFKVNGDIDMDGEKVGRMVAPTVARTYRMAGAY